MSLAIASAIAYAGKGKTALSYQESVLASSPYYWAKFNETSGTAHVNSAGTTADGVYEGSPLLAQAPLFGGGVYSAYFDGVNDDTYFPARVTTDTAFTVEAIVKKENPIDGAGMIMFMGDEASAIIGGWHIYVNQDVTNTEISLRWWSGAVWAYTTSTGMAISNGTTAHITVKVNWTTLSARFYKNGVFVCENNTGTGADGTYAAYPAYMGLLVRGAARDHHWKGWMDEVIYYPSLLDDATILQHATLAGF